MNRFLSNFDDFSRFDHFFPNLPFFGFPNLGKLSWNFVDFSGLRNCVNKEYLASYPGGASATNSGHTAHSGPAGNSEPVNLLPANGVSYYQGGIPPVQQAHSTTAHDPPHSVTVTQGVPPGSVAASVAGLPGLSSGLARLPPSPAQASALAMATAAAAQQKDD